jgi:hypothetical protein
MRRRFPTSYPNQNLLDAARCGDIGAIRAALAESAGGLNQALVEASKAGQVIAAGYLIDRGADLHASRDQALRLAARQGQAEVLRLLLDRGADLHAMDECALYWAASNDRLEAAQLLLERGADIDALAGYPCPAGPAVAKLLRQARWKRRLGRWGHRLGLSGLNAK